MFGSVEIKTRPIRLAYLVEPNNSDHVREAMRLNSTLWGGAFVPIIPLWKRMPTTWKDPVKTPAPKAVILGYLDAFDPDFLVQFAKELPQFITDTGIHIIKPEDIWRATGQERALSPRFGIGIFELLNQIFEEHFRYKEKYPVRVVFPKLPNELSLFWLSIFGELPTEIAETVNRHYAKPLEIETPEFRQEQLADFFERDVFVPRSISRYGLRHENRAGFRARDACVYFLDATKIEDIVDLWNLRALGRRVLPVPKQLQTSEPLREIVSKFLIANRRPWPHNPKVCDHASFIRARSCTMDEMQAYATTIKIDRKPDDPSDSPFLSLQHWYPRIWEEWGRDKDGALPDDVYDEDEHSIELTGSEEPSIRFRPFLPKFAEEHVFHDEPRCANELIFRLYGPTEHVAEVFPKSSGEHFTRAISSLAALRGDWRVGKNGLVKLVKNSFTEHWTIPTAESVMFAWFRDKGWNPQLSPPGLLARQIYLSLGGSSAILKNEAVLGLFEHMNGGSVEKSGAPVEENKITQERDLPVGEVRSRLKGERGDLYGYLTSKSIFKLGARLQCPRCLRNSWFSLESIRDSFTCPKCLNVFPAIGNLDSATWSHKTAGPFSVPQYADGAYAVLLALEMFSGRHLTTLQTTPVLSFTAESPEGKKIEADFALFWQESLYGERRDGILFGECKTYGRFGEKDFARMRHLASIFPGAVLVFSTLRKSLTDKEIVGITRIAKAGRKYWKPERPINPVMILTGTELLHWSGPPYCWEDTLKDKFRHLMGVIGICNATQQIYLKLPPWETEWHEQWERKARRRSQKLNAPASGQSRSG